MLKKKATLAVAMVMVMALILPWAVTAVDNASFRSCKSLPSYCWNDYPGYCFGDSALFNGCDLRCRTGFQVTPWLHCHPDWFPEY